MHVCVGMYQTHHTQAHVSETQLWRRVSCRCGCSERGWSRGMALHIYRRLHDTAAGTPLDSHTHDRQQTPPASTRHTSPLHKRLKSFTRGLLRYYYVYCKHFVHLLDNSSTWHMAVYFSHGTVYFNSCNEGYDSSTGIGKKCDHRVI